MVFKINGIPFILLFFFFFLHVQECFSYIGPIVIVSWTNSDALGEKNTSGPCCSNHR